MKTKQQLLDFFGVKLNKVYELEGSILYGNPKYFRVVDVKNNGGIKELMVQTKLDYPNSPKDWEYYNSDEPLTFLSRYDYKLAPSKPLLKEEKSYFHTIIWPLKHEIEYISKVGRGDKEWIEIATCSSPEEGYEKEVVSLYKFPKGSEYKKMKRNKKYSLKELELDQPYKAVLAKYEKNKGVK
jgi:hypothetical protein